MRGRDQIETVRQWQAAAPRMLVWHRRISFGVICAAAALAVANCLPAIKSHFAASGAVSAFCRADATRGALGANAPFDALLQPLKGRFDHRPPVAGGWNGTF